MRKVCSFLLVIALICGLWVSAGAEKATLEAGSYTVGSDIPAGDYEITCVKVSNFYTDYMDSMQSLAGDDPELNALFGLYGSLADTMEATVKIKGPYGENKGSFSIKEKDKKKVTLQKDWIITIEDGVLDFELVKAAAEEPVASDDRTTTSGTSSSTVDVDLSGYSDAEIVALYELVGQEIVNRKINKSARVSAGDYVIGEDIPAGKYLLEKTVDSKYDHVTIYSDKTKAIELESKQLWDPVTSCVVTVETGNLIVIPCDMLLTIYTGVSFN